MYTTPPAGGDVPTAVLSGPTVLIEYAGLRLLTDPTFDEPGAHEMAGQTVEKTGRSPMTPGELGRIDAVLLSHDEHADNLDGTGRDLLRRIPLTLTTVAAAPRLGGTALGLAFWEEHTIRSATGTVITVTAVPARHGPVGSEPYTGDVVGFVLSAPDHPRVYVSGDNAALDAVEQIAARFAPIDTAVIYIGGVRNDAFFDGALLTFDNAHAASAAELLQARRVIPAHFEGWSHYTGGREDLIETFADRGLSDTLDFAAPAQAPRHP